MNPSTTLCSALFVDFDNMYSRLKDLPDPSLASSFARQPNRWLEWLEKKLTFSHLDEGYTARRILIRKCYLNPAWYGEFRPYFTRAAFEVTDCPILTKGGKTSTDILMVMDIMDALRHPSQFDEFIVFSADADFSPVLLRVRQHNRRSVILAVGYSSAAYKSASDYVLPVDEFFREALGLGQAEEVEKPQHAPVQKVSNSVLDRLGTQLLLTLDTEPVVYADELVAVYKRVEDFRLSTSWLGYNSLAALSKAVTARKPELEFVEESDEDSWGIRRKEGAQSLAVKTPPALQNPVLRKTISEWIINTVRSAPQPVVMGELAEGITAKFGDQINGSIWLGAGSFKSLLEQLDLGGLVINSVTPGVVYDPAKHNLAELQAVAPLGDERRIRIENEFKTRYPQIEPLAIKIHDLTDMPYLLPEHYALILQQVARAVNENGFQLAQITRLVRDRCVERGAPIARSHVNFVVIGINYAGHKMGEDESKEDPHELAGYLYENARNLCQAAQFILSDAEETLLHQWLFGCLDELPPA